MRILVTGATGVLGEAIASRLLRDTAVSRLVTVSRGAAPAWLKSNGRVEHVRADFRAPQVAERLRGVDVLLHAAFQPYGRNPDRLRQVNVTGSNALHRAAVAAGVRYVVFVSSVAAFGSNPDNAVPLGDDAPLRPTRRSFYSLHKAEVEFDLMELDAANGDLNVLRVRPCVLVGPRADLGTEAIRFYYHVIAPRFSDERSLWQFMRTFEAAEAIVRAIEMRLTGPLNVSSGDWLTHEELVAITGGRIIDLPARSRAIMPAVKALRLSPVGEDRTELTRYPMVMDNARLRAELGMDPASSADALRQFLRYPKPKRRLAGFG